MDRKDYMEHRATHREYYGSIVKEAGIVFPADHPLVVAGAQALSRGDEHMNTIPLSRWDDEAARRQAYINRALREHGDFWSMAGGVCVMKEAVRQAIERGANDAEV